MPVASPTQYNKHIPKLNKTKASLQKILTIHSARWWLKNLHPGSATGVIVLGASPQVLAILFSMSPVRTEYTVGRLFSWADEDEN